MRLGLATNGFNQFGTMSNNYSMWHVILMSYNVTLEVYEKEFVS